MKKIIINTAISLTALVSSFLPQKAEACKADCLLTSCDTGTPGGICFCTLGIAVCIAP